jgi:competence ComEA-like helix-hairpin-helix protein
VEPEAEDPPATGEHTEEQPLPPASQASSGAVSLATASVDDLRRIGMSTRQAKRVVRYRDERGLDSVEALRNVPGFSRSFVERIRQRISD